MVQNIAPHFRLLSAYMCRLEILETSSMLTWHVATALMLDAHRRQTPSVGLLIYSMEVLSRLTICYFSIFWLYKFVFNLGTLFVINFPTCCTLLLLFLWHKIVHYLRIAAFAWSLSNWPCATKPAYQQNKSNGTVISIIILLMLFLHVISYYLFPVLSL